MRFIFLVCSLLLVTLGSKKQGLISISTDSANLQAQVCLVHVAERSACAVPFYEVVDMGNTDLQCFQTATNKKLVSCPCLDVPIITLRTD